jgi:hypothetical protein
MQNDGDAVRKAEAILRHERFYAELSRWLEQRTAKNCDWCGRPNPVCDFDRCATRDRHHEICGEACSEPSPRCLLPDDFA